MLRCPLLPGIVIGTIQLGACVDYAILMTTRVREELGKHADRKEAVRIAIEKKRGLRSSLADVPSLQHVSVLH